MIYYVYMLNCIDSKNNHSIYTGSTDNIGRRIEQHRSGKGGAKYTRGKDIKLGYFETFLTRGEAMKREYAIKQLSSKKKKQLIEDFQKNLK